MKPRHATLITPPRCLLSPLLLLLLLLLSSSLPMRVPLVGAFPFPPSSPVVELTPSSLPRFLASHKPVFILLYAPWCGHCRRMHPAWEAFAQGLRGTARVGAINADTHKSLAQQFNIRGFPTIKYWNLGLHNKEIHKAMEYDGPREAAAMQAKAMSLISSSNVKMILNSDALREAAWNAPEKKVAVLFSAKNRVPAIFSVLSHSPKLKSMPFYFVGSQAKAGIAAEFGVEQLPSIVVLNVSEGSEIKTLKYPQKQIAYEPIAKFLFACVTNGVNENGEILMDNNNENNNNNNNNNKDNKGSSATKSSSNSENKNMKPALPVRPVRLTSQALINFCSPASTQRIGERAPLCVVSLTSSFSLDSVHKLFQNEPFLFFEANSDRELLRTTLLENFSLTEVAENIKDEKENHVLLLRAPKNGNIRYKLLNEIKTADDLNIILQKVVSGELPLEKKGKN